MHVEVLQKLGLSGGEIKVYSVLLSSGSVSINTVHERTGIDRRSIYDILNRLIERGFVTYIRENKKRLFQVSNPDRIIDYIEYKKSELEKTEEDIKQELPEFSKQFNLKLPEIYSEVYRGVEGMKALWDDMLNYGGIYWIGAGRYMPKMFPAWFSNWNRRRIEKGIVIHNLMRDELRGEIKELLELEELKFLPKEFSGSPVVIGIQGPKVVHMMLGQKLFAFIIQSSELAENYMHYHKYLWDHVAKPFKKHR